MATAVCKSCGTEDLIAPKSGICAMCGFRNPPLFDPVAEQWKKEDEARETAEAELAARRDALKKQLDEVAKAFKAGEHIGMALGQLSGSIDQFQNAAMTMEYQKLQAGFFKAEGLKREYLSILAKMVKTMPFDAENHNYFYELAAGYEESGNDAAAHVIYDKFIKNYMTSYKDVKARHLATEHATGLSSGYPGEGIRIRLGAFEMGAESIADWIGAANRSGAYFSDSILLSEDEQFEEIIDDISISSQVELEKVNQRIQRFISSDNVLTSVEQVSIIQKGALGEEGVHTLVFRPGRSGGSLDLGMVGGIHVAARLIVPQVGGGRMTVSLYVFFHPRAAEELGDRPYRDFNDSVQDVLQRIHPIVGNRSLCEEVEALKKAVVSAAREELHSMNLRVPKVF